MADKFNDAAHWSRMAAEMRVIAEKVTDVSSKRTLLLSIERYEALAARSRTRASAKDKPHPA